VAGWGTPEFRRSAILDRILLDKPYFSYILMNSNFSPSSGYREVSSQTLHAIRVEDIPEEGLELHLLERKDVWNSYLHEIPRCEFSIEEDVRATIKLRALGQAVRLQGGVDTVLTLQCCRCLEPYSCPLTSRIDVTLFRETETVPEEETELGREDLKASFFSGEEIDISGLIREQIILATPLKPLCRERCKGLCPQCGANLNEGDCRCEKGTRQSVFDVLKNLKLNEK